MSVFAIAIVVVGAIAVAIGVVLGVRFLRGQFAPRTRTWVVRSSRDRRQRKVRLAVERRRGPRRQEDIAKRFLSGIGKSTVTQRLRPRGPH